MAEGLLFSAAEMMLQTLGSAAMEEIGLLWGVDDEFESLLDTLLAIKAVLRDAEKKKKAGNEQVKFWLERLENVVSEADDMLDEVATEDLRRQVMPGKNEIVKKVRTFFSSSNQAAFRRKMAHKIKHIREKLDRIAAIRERFHLEESYEEILSVGRVRESHSSLGEDDLDLRVVEKEDIVELLLNPNQNRTQQEKLSVLPIVGMGGLGKTTLAKLVYNC